MKRKLEEEKTNVNMKKSAKRLYSYPPRCPGVGSLEGELWITIVIAEELQPGRRRLHNMFYLQDREREPVKCHEKLVVYNANLREAKCIGSYEIAISQFSGMCNTSIKPNYSIKETFCGVQGELRKCRDYDRRTDFVNVLKIFKDSALDRFKEVSNDYSNGYAQFHLQIYD
ncbi:16455_t:CDS:2 [Acaulospora morrowiae]|uniref:16455_t:CDS:1 n=1 Tax=Acaulospora morrowiae TaxID=94023 RepID=A0A9N9G2G7_9GLOM|nr:16455_t:CDS:2 [Acaulospora morrowiae]